MTAAVPSLPLCESYICAVVFYIQAAGGQVLQHEGGKEGEPGDDVRYNKEDPLNPFFVVYGNRRAPSV